MSISFNTENDELSIFIDGELYKKLKRIKATPNDITLTSLFYLEDLDDCLEEIWSISPKDFPTHLYLSVPYESKEYPRLRYITILRGDKSKTIAEFHVNFDFVQWAKPVTTKEYFLEYKNALQALGYDVEIENDGFISGVIIKTELKGKSLQECINNISKIAHIELDKLDNKIVKNNSENLLTMIFSFPEEYQVICSQYLLWFGEVLKELGIKSEVSSETKNGKTFLTIDPKDQFDLKVEIEKALYMYLSLPYSEYIALENCETDIEKKAAYQLLKSQVDDFKQKIELKKSILEFKSLTNEKLRHDLDEANNRLLLLESIENSKIELFDGAFTISEYQLGPVKINPKKLLKIFKPSQKA